MELTPLPLTTNSSCQCKISKFKDTFITQKLDTDLPSFNILYPIHYPIFSRLFPSEINMQKTKSPLIKDFSLYQTYSLDLEAPPRFELGDKGFADLCLTTWLWRHIISQIEILKVRYQL